MKASPHKETLFSRRHLFASGKATTNQVIMGLAIVILAGFVVWRLFPRPDDGRAESCIVAPQLETKIANDEAVKLITKFEQQVINGSGDASRNFQTVTAETFQKLDNKTAAFLIGMRAADCFLKHRTAAGDQAAVETTRSMRDFLLEELRSEQGMQGAGTELMPGETAILKQSDLGKTALDEFTALDAKLK
ncbi:hypothetical protein [Luteolibacter luteus]|uniref:Uncharacterized protein n=1 Tax=Luteolibacter luteus TaxID=2728835 RepID=A0A858RLB4_9BACT|nr:hypothetical protein [Luteolibacter luteus]QJE97737.1 hypothetical protein HHL09_18765 [Luteolibacter luteus]